MKFTTLSVQNFLSIKEAKIDLNDRGLVLIEGINEDDPSAKSNGAGKSSIVDALCWCLYGKTARGVSSDAVVNRKTKKNCCVSVLIQDGEDEYLVVRSRKHGKNGTGLAVSKVETFFDYCKSTALTKGTTAETQTFVEELIGCPYEVFVAAVYAGQEAMPDLPSMTDKQLKTLIEEVIGVDRLTAAYAKANAKYREAVDAVQRAVFEEQKLVDEGNTQLAWQKDIFEKEQKWGVERDIKRDALEIRHSHLLRDKLEESARVNKAKADAMELQKHIDEVRKKLKKTEDERNAIAALRTDLLSKQYAADGLRNDYLRVGNALKQRIDEVKSFDAKIGTKCSECGKVYQAEDLAEAKAIVTKAAQDLAVEVRRANAAWQDAVKTVQEAEDKVNKVVLSDTRSLNLELDECLAKLRSIDCKPADYQSAIEQVEHQIEALSVPNPYTDQLDKVNARINELNELIKNARAKIENRKKNEEVFKGLTEVFGPKGVRAHILDTITPLLNDRTARYLDVLSDGKLRAVWTTLSMTKKGEVREQFNIAVSNEVGGGTFESLSGGEKRKVRVACCLALQEIVASRATKPIELFIADEVDHALDEAGVERLIGVLNEKAETCKSLFVISHNPLRNWIDNVITIKKKDGYSEIGC